MNKLIYILILLSYSFIYAQHEMNVKASLSQDGKILHVDQSITYKNNNEKSLNFIYLYDWINAFSDKNSELGKSFSEEFVRKFHFASEAERGGTRIKSLTHNSRDLIWKRPQNYPDVIQVKLDENVEVGETYEIEISYEIIIPDAKFTNFGIDKDGLKLKYWLLKPAFHNKEWYIYSNRRLYDMPQQVLDLELSVTIPQTYNLTTALVDDVTKENTDLTKTIAFPSQSVVDTDLYILKNSNFYTTDTEYTTLVTNIDAEVLPPEAQSLISYRVLGFLKEKLGDYPFQKLLISETEYQLSPVYGLNQLPSFIRPFPDGFQYDIKLIKAVSAKYLKNTILTNSRNNKWMLDAIQINLMMEYVDLYYNKMKLLGKFSDFFIVDWFHVADLEFNDQYDFLYKNVTRNNIHQSLSTPQDSLIKFNQKIGNPYQAGLGMRYLKQYTSAEQVDRGIKSFYENFKLEHSDLEDFRFHLSQNIGKDISWFFENYTDLSSPIDFKIKSVKKIQDSLEVTLKNDHQTNLPVSLFWIKDKKPIHKIWIDPFEDEKTIKIERLDAERLAVNYDGIIPEVNSRNNFKSVTKLFNKPLQVRLLEDVEDPHYSQMFVMPEFSYNLYDGVSIGPKLYNKSFLPRQLEYKISPKYGFNNGAIVGSGSINFTSWQYDKDLFGVRMGVNGSRFSYDFDLFFERYSAYFTLMYRENKNRRNNMKQALSVRTVNVRRDRDISNPVEDPDYNVFNVSYNYQDKNLDRFFTARVDYEIAQKFSKLFATTTFRRLYENNRQINLRLFAGTFLYNDTGDSDFFSFALDRPSDYMFDYNYYGRSEESGLFSQQFIMAEGGFKSQLEPDFANEWITTLNVSTTIWNWIFAYADAGFVGNRFSSPKFVYDSGVRFVFVEDYFELYLPVYSNKGWEFDQSNYDQNIRFIVSIDFDTLFRLFTRKWY